MNNKIVLCHKCSCGPSLNLIRNICVHSVLESNHYKVLGLTPSATQAEIKSAYYELSKIHHPDKNQGSEKSAKIFKDISAAYEVLGNEKSRKLYDREQAYKRPEATSYQRPTYRTDYNDEYERYFYEKTRRATRVYYGKTPYYDFDAWYRAHYVRPNKYYTARQESVRKKYSNINNKEDDFITRVGALVLILYFITVFSLFVLKKQPSADKNLEDSFKTK